MSDENEDVVSEQGEEETAAVAPAAKKQKTSLYAVPTPDEMTNLKATQELFKSNLFKLQLDDLLSSVSVDRAQKLEAFLHSIKSHLDSMPASKIALKPGAKVLSRKLKFFTERKLEMAFQPPSRVDLVGSYLLDAVCKPLLNVDMTVEIPRACLAPKDHTNYRYFDKRCAYLNVVKKHLEAQPELKGLVSVDTFRGDPDKPILVVTPPLKGALKRFRIRIFPAIDPATFPPHKLAPDRCCTKRTLAVGETEAVASPPTPHYNQRVLEDAHFRTHLEELHGWASDCPALAPATVLLKVWARRRGLLRDDAFNGFTLAMVLSHLLRQRKVVKQMSSYQIVRAALLFLSESDLAGKGIAMKPIDSAAGKAVDLAKHVAAFDVSFLDRTGVVNLTARVSASAYESIVRQAKMTLTCLDSALSDGFEEIFVKELDFTQQYDAYIAIQVPSADKASTTPATPIYARHPTLAAAPAVARRAFRLLKQAFGARVTAIDVRVAGPRLVQVGLLLDPSACRAPQDKGPSAEDQAAGAAFRRFWGTKSQLRRFKDGSIVELVSWEDSPPELVVFHVAQHILTRHIANLQAPHVAYIGHQLDSVMLYRPARGKEAVLPPDPQAPVEGLQKALFELTTVVRGLEDVPITFVSVGALHPAVRGTDPFPPVPVEDPSLLRLRHPKDAMTPVEVVLHLESSSKWPDDLAAISRIKSAFYIKLGSTLRSKHQFRTTVALDFLDVLVKGFVFRTRIFHDREVLIHQTDAREAEEKRIALAAYKQGATPDLTAARNANTPWGREIERDMIHRPLLASALKGFGGRFPAYTATCRLAKRWLGAHMLSPCLSDDAVDLLVAHLFSNPAPYAAPGSAFNGLHRFLRLLGWHDFEKLPLLVDLVGDTTAAVLQELQGKFDQARAKGPHPCAWIATPQHQDSAFTMHQPTPLSLKRLATYARASAQHLGAQVQASVTESPMGGEKQTPSVLNTALWKALFRTPLDKFDVLITLDPSLVPGTRRALQLGGGAKPPREPDAGKLEERFKNNPDEVLTAPLPLVGFDPVALYCRDLKERCGPYADVYFDALGGTTVGVVWKPGVFEPVPFAVARCVLATPKDKGFVTPDKANLLKLFHDLGSNFVLSVTEQVQAAEEEE
jgi:U3 small nucleolar RNA-associated protein 22